MLKFYHNPSCRKSRAGKQYLEEAGVPFIVVEYLKNRLSEKDLEKLLMKLNLKAGDVMRKQEAFYKQHLRGKNFLEHELIRIIADQPTLLQRPIVEGDYKAVIGDPPENIAPLL